MCCVVSPDNSHGCAAAGTRHLVFLLLLLLVVVVLSFNTPIVPLLRHPSCFPRKTSHRHRPLCKLVERIIHHQVSHVEVVVFSALRASNVTASQGRRLKKRQNLERAVLRMSSAVVFTLTVVLLVAAAWADDNNSTALCSGGNCDRTLAASTSKDGDTSSPNKVIVLSRHQKKCTIEEARETACIRGNGECYAVYLGFARVSFCVCGALYQGARCEQICAECYARVLEEESAQSAEVHSGVWVAVAAAGSLIVGIVIGIIVGRKCKKPEEQKPGDASKQPLRR